MDTKEVYEELDNMYSSGINIDEAAEELHRRRPQVPTLFCNKFVLDWSKERGHNVSEKT
jgi:hypothetical protein